MYRAKPQRDVETLCHAERQYKASSDRGSRYPLSPKYIPIIRQQIFRSASYLRLRKDSPRQAFNQALGWYQSRNWPRVGPKLGFLTASYKVGGAGNE